MTRHLASAGAEIHGCDPELQDVAPGGFLLFSAHGDACTDPLTSDELVDYGAGRVVVRLGERAGASECAAFHPPAYVRSVLTAGWDLIEHAPGGATGNPPQDAYLLRTRAHINDGHPTWVSSRADVRSQ